MSTFRLAYDKTVALGYRMDVVFYLLRIGLFFTDHELIKSNIEKAQRSVNNLVWVWPQIYDYQLIF